MAVGSKPGASVTLTQLAAALRQPLYTPSLGRRSCPLARPLLEGELEAEDALAALAKTAPVDGLVYSETQQSDQPLRLRDVPLHGHKRQFGTRLVYLHKDPTCS
ncbi:hypothetical protein TPL01_05310 [Sulfuriferula plumbiphila]|uniref:Uncharacterized protein n=1 Tax=Sulfuriferula plumbiphila TaxID=171865 RepID=A0A512L4J1_9PROT|nr:hypothetical protein SFPGR_12000 [Sulfuriferula plumbiphila]GEP29393.1 hypothetical protein TPL01_05310 [Sulfuriferula plumbiphila]